MKARIWQFLLRSLGNFSIRHEAAKKKEKFSCLRVCFGFIVY
jgi:hypothetical protein